MSRFLQGAAAFTMTAGIGVELLAGCGDLETPTPTPPTPSVTADSYSQIRYGNCIPPLSMLNRTVQIAAAKACAATEADATVAFVTYDDTSMQLAKSIVGSVTSLVTEASGNIVHVKSTVVPASQTAIDALGKTVAADGCIKSDDAESFGSTIAAETMPALNSFDFVEAFVPYPACDSKIGGVTDPSKGRLSDVFVPAAEQHNDDGTPDPGFTKETATQAAAHELLHNFELGHYGRITFHMPDGTLTQLGNTAQATNEYNLTALIAAGYSYQAYDTTAQSAPGVADSKNVMGANITSAIPGQLIQDLPSAMQLNELDWPKAILANKSDYVAHTVTATPSLISLAEASQNAYFSVPLDEQVPLTDESAVEDLNGQAGYGLFDRITIVPVIMPVVEGAYDQYICGANIFFADARAESAYAGLIRTDGAINDDNRIVLTIGAQKIEVAVVNGQMQASLIGK